LQSRDTTVPETERGNLMNNPAGMLLIHKQRGQTSFQVIGAVRKLLGIKKVGHAGILDKEAEGLLLVCFGKATRLLTFLSGLDKTYEAEITFGSQTATDDVAGEVTATSDLKIDHESVLSALPRFTGTISQVPPDYSQVHVNGKRAYKMALQGQKPDLKPRTVHIHELTPVEFYKNRLVVKVTCSKGTYIRSLARDLGLETGYYAHMSALTRSRVGPFSLENASKLGAIKTDSLQVVDPFHILPFIESLEIYEEKRTLVTQGRPLREEWLLSPADTDGIYRLHCREQLLAMVSRENGRYRYKFVF
jgi:tRNA pseudouridine55 synthase